MTEPPPLGKWFFKLFISSNVFCLLLDATVVFEWKKYSLLLFGAYELFCCSRWSGTADSPLSQMGYYCSPIQNHKN